MAIVNEELWSLPLNSFLLQDTSLALCFIELIASGSTNLNVNLFTSLYGRGPLPPPCDQTFYSSFFFLDLTVGIITYKNSHADM